MHRCPVCGYDELPYPPRNFNICPSCGTEFENDDFGTTEAEVKQRQLELRNAWVTTGPSWFSRVTPQPPHWDGLAQLLHAGFPARLPGRLDLMPVHGLRLTIRQPYGVKMTEGHKRVRLYA